MKKTRILLFFNTMLLLSFFYYFKAKTMKAEPKKITNFSTIKNKNMKLGAFSVSLSVKNLEVSKKFYETLGFEVFGGDMKQHYLIMKSENTLIGLFQGMFEGNMLTFNPGWNQEAKNLDEFNDIREIQKELKNQEIKLESEADESTSGPASFIVKDPDGNILLFDQHR